MKVLFICIGNVARSQIAEEVFNTHSDHEAISAGLGVEDYGIDGLTVADMKNIEPHASRYPLLMTLTESLGLDINNKSINQVTPELAETADKIILLDAMTPPDYLVNNDKVELWSFPDALYGGEDEAVKIMKEVASRVEEFAKELA